ncbi:MAG TPA: TlpA disulfide reductase family protein [Mycobacteriales bacterium]|jgi:thiol-disulfide isomerase/thioredoxin|nr:TlpA disulfide reductase family protein [Mycobacteriales bacterium]
MPGKLRHLIAAAAVLVGVAGCSGTGNVDTSVNGGGTQNGAGNIVVYKAADRHMVGDVKGTTLQGKPLNLASYRGKVVIVDFWSDPCVPCHGEEPAMEQLAQADVSKGVQFVGIDERDNLSAGQAFEAQFHVTYPSIFDRYDSYVLDFPGSAPPSTPSTIVLDPTGHIAAQIDGPQDYSHLNALINQIRSEPA